MSFSHEYTFPVFVSNGSVLESGHSSTLAPSQLMIATQKDHMALTGNASKMDALKIIQGSFHTKDKLGQYYGGLRKSDESPAFLTSGILEFRKSLPRAAKSEEWVLGWDGVNSTKTINFECGKKEYRFKIKVWGEDVYGTYLRPVEREIGIMTDCCPGTGCDDTCDDSVAGIKYVKAIAAAINNDPELKFFVDAEAIWSTASTNAATHRLYTIRIPDEGTQLALAFVQEQSGFSVERIGRDGIYSTYQAVTVLDAPDGSPVDTPDDVTPVSPIELALCKTCPSGYTTVAGTSTWVVERPLSGATDLSTDGAKQTYADAVGLAYFPAITFNGATAVEVVASSDAITLTAHGLATGEKVRYSNGGGTTIVGLTNSTDYYVIKVDADTIKLATTAANAYAGTVIAIADGVGAAHTLTPSVTATFLSQDGSTAKVQIVAAYGHSTSALLSDTVALESSMVATCTPPAGSAISWVAGEDRYKTTRTLKLTLNKECGTDNRLADLVAFYADNEDVAVAPSVSTSGTCSDIYTITQYSKNLLEDGCLTEGAPSFNTLPAFEGFTWTPDPVSEGDSSVLVGVRLKTAYTGATQFGGCSFHPNDYYSVRPLSLEVTQLVGGPGDRDAAVCKTPVPSMKTQYVSMPTQSGEYAIREFIKANKYRINGEYFVDPRLREVLDTIATDAIDRHKTYVIYYFKVVAHRPVMNHIGDYSPEVYEFQIFAPLGTDMSAVEDALSKVASQNGVYMTTQ